MFGAAHGRPPWSVPAANRLYPRIPIIGLLSTAEYGLSIEPARGHLQIQYSKGKGNGTTAYVVRIILSLVTSIELEM